jgi:Dolichyl-phosphate-mannose-protein mannosyltransferase
MVSSQQTTEDMQVQPFARPSALSTASSPGDVFSRAAGVPASARSGRSSAWSVAAGLGLAVLLLATTVARFVFRADAPLWMDEVWTGMIASQRSLAGFAHQCYLDVNAPLGYVVAWLWEPIGGLSNQGLRLPSAIFASLAPLVALAPSRSIPLRERAIWAGLLACWLPGFIFASEARCYALLLCLGVANTLAFTALLRSPGLRPALWWAASSSLLILTHYFAILVVGCQGVAYLIVCRRQAVRTWPALIAFVPALAEMAAHAAVLRHFSAALPATPTSPRWGDLPDALEFVIGGMPTAWLVALCVLAGALVARLQGKDIWPRTPSAKARNDGRLWVVPATALASIVLCVVAYQVCLAASWARPILVVRYFTAATPGVLLGLALVLGRISDLWRPAPAIVIGAQGLIALALLLSGGPKAQPISFQRAAEALMKADVSRVEFFYDDRGAGGRDHDAFSQIGGFFFHRAGRPIVSDAVFIKPGLDPNPVLLERAREGGTAILWLYNTDVQWTAATRFPPRISQIDPRWRCHDYGMGAAHALACIQAGAQ